jgi:uncharacterized membrane protein YcaP (DUF421 family)
MELLQSLLSIKTSPLELVLRGTLMYWFLFLIFRFVLRRDTGSVGIADVLMMVLVADAAQNGMAGDYHTLPEGFVLVSTLIGWNVLLDWAAFRFKPVRRWVEAPPLLLVSHGRVLHRNMRREFLTMDELQAKLRQSGVANIADVRQAFLESDGNFSVLLRASAKDEPRAADGAHR